MTTAKAFRRLTLLTATAALALAAFGAPGAAAACPEHDGLPFGVTAGCFDGIVNADESGTLAATEAGAHPYAATVQIKFNTRTDAIKGSLWPSEPIKDVLVDAPAGLLGNPTVLQQCSLDQLLGGPANDFRPECPPGAQVGVITVSASGGPEAPLPLDVFIPSVFADQPLYNMVAPPDAPARFAFKIAGTVVNLDGEVRSDGDYGVSVDIHNNPEALPLFGSTVTLWGDPADPSHKPQRWCSGGGAEGPRCEAGIPPRAFLRLPTSCSGPQATVAHLDSWFNPGASKPDGSPDLSDPNWKEASFLSHRTEAEGGEPVGVNGCEEVPFEPSFSAKPTTNQADSPTGLVVDLTIPQDELGDPEAIAQSDLKGAEVILPEGMTVNPSSADGLGSCTLAQIDLHSRNTEPTCPDSSKIGSVEIKTPLLEEELEGSVYLAAQKDNPFDSLLALYIVAEARGQVVKLAGQVQAGPEGQLTTTFDNQPQLPFEALHLVLKGGPRAPLLTPAHCGAFSTQATLTPWSGNAPVELQSSFDLVAGPNGSCANTNANRPFDPKLSAGTTNPVGGAFSPFLLRLQREDGTKELAALSATLPEGLLGKLAGIPYCPEAALASVSEAEGTAAAQIASPSCPAASQLGKVTVGAGAGSSPFYVKSGKAYLAGPYKGAPLSLAIVTPALAGPFDLGSVLVRTALRVDPETAQITAASDPLPRFLHGIALDLRDVRVDVDRPGFTINPTDCDPMSIGATIGGAEGASAQRSVPFQVANCAALPFKPKLSLKLKGATHRGDDPALRATLTMPPGSANIARASVALPHSEFLDQAHIRTVCTRVQFAAEACPAGSIYGHARAFTPLLDQPLEGPVYLRSSDNPLPDLVADLRGQIHIVLDGRIDSKDGGIRTTFATVPDAPVSKFVLTMKGGKRGLLENSADLCARPHRATVQIDAHNGKIGDSRPLVKADCGKSKGNRRR